MELQVPHNKAIQPVSVHPVRLAHDLRPSGADKARPRFGPSASSEACQSSPGPDPATVPHAAGPGQLLYSANGLFVVHSDAGHWVVPPATVLQLSPGVAYTVRKAEHVRVRTVTLSDALSQRLASENCLYRFTPLLRELLEALHGACADQHAVHDSKALLLVDLLSEAGMWRDQTAHRCRCKPSDARVAHICDYVYNNLDAPRTLQEWASELQIDTRTLHRLFVQEFGMPFVQWRQQTRLMAALEWLAEGRQIMDVALDLGYQTQSAFAAMFRRNMGMTPREWQDKRRPDSVRSSYTVA